MSRDKPTAKLPPLTHLQFLILSSLVSGEKAGKELRALLKKEGVSKTGPAFYQLMSRLEEAGLVDGRYEQKIIDSQIIKQRRYKINGSGVKAYNATREFYFAHGTRNYDKGGLLGA